MKPPATMPLPWTVKYFPHKGGENAFIFDKDGMFFQEAYGDDQEQAAAYIQHCVNVYPSLIESLEKLARLGNGDQYGNSNGNIIAQDALRKAGEI